MAPCHETDEQEMSMRKKFKVALKGLSATKSRVTSGCLDKPDWDVRAGAMNVRMVGIQSRKMGSGWEEDREERSRASSAGGWGTQEYPHRS